MKGYIQGLITGISIMGLMMFNSCETRPMKIRDNTISLNVKNILTAVRDLEGDIVELKDYNHRIEKEVEALSNQLDYLQTSNINEDEMKAILKYDKFLHADMLDDMGDELKKHIRKYCDD